MKLEESIIAGYINVPDFASIIDEKFRPNTFEYPESQLLVRALQALDSGNIKVSKNNIGIALDCVETSPQTKQSAFAMLDTIYAEQYVNDTVETTLEAHLARAEKYFKKRASIAAVTDAIKRIDGGKDLDGIPKMLEEAIGFTFDKKVGHDYVADAGKRFMSYHTKAEMVPFRIPKLSYVTGGGAHVKSLIVPVAPTGVGKSFFMTDWSAHLITNGYDVLYVTLELAEERIAERIDMNVLRMNKSELMNITCDTFKARIAGFAKKFSGNLIIKEYSPTTFSSGMLVSLLEELKRKKGFTPKVIMIDYLNLMASSRGNGNSVTDGYGYVKAISEELRGVAMKYDCIICAPTQTNRSGINTPEFSLTEISDSIGTAMTADFVFGMVQTEDLATASHMKIIQLKNRWGSITGEDRVLYTEVDKSRMTMATRPSDEFLNSIGVDPVKYFEYEEKMEREQQRIQRVLEKFSAPSREELENLIYDRQETTADATNDEPDRLDV